MMGGVTRVVIIGGGPGGYEAALVAAQLGASVTVVDRDGLGGSAVLTDCVPSKTLIAAAESRSADGDLSRINRRILDLARAQSHDIADRLDRDGVRIMRGWGRLDSPESVRVTTIDGQVENLDADVVLLATGARPRVLPDAIPDGERILTRVTANETPVSGADDPRLAWILSQVLALAFPQSTRFEIDAPGL